MARPYLENQAGSAILVAAGIAAAVLGFFFLRSRAAPAAPTPAPTPAPPRCVGTMEALTNWARAYGFGLAFLPQRTSPPTKSEVAAMGFDISSPERIVAVLSDTSFWTYATASDKAVPAPQLRADYCATVT